MLWDNQCGDVNYEFQAKRENLKHFVDMGFHINIIVKAGHVYNIAQVDCEK